jgi:hypothetical protein
MIHDIEPREKTRDPFTVAAEALDAERARSARLREYINAIGHHAAVVGMYNNDRRIAESWQRVRDAKAAIDDNGDLEVLGDD